MRTYQHSGIVPVTAAIQSLAIGSAAAVVLGIVYTFSFYYIPYVYLNFLLAMGFGCGVGWCVGWTAHEGKIRNTGVAVALAVVAALIGIYAEWGTTLYALAPAAEIPQYWKEAGLSTYLPLNLGHDGASFPGGLVGTYCRADGQRLASGGPVAN